MHTKSIHIKQSIWCRRVNVRVGSIWVPEFLTWTYWWMILKSSWPTWILYLPEFQVALNIYPCHVLTANIGAGHPTQIFASNPCLLSPCHISHSISTRVYVVSCISCAHQAPQHRYMLQLSGFFSMNSYLDMGVLLKCYFSWHLILSANVLKLRVCLIQGANTNKDLTICHGLDIVNLRKSKSCIQTGN